MTIHEDPGTSRIRQEKRFLTFYVWACTTCGLVMRDWRKSLLDHNIVQHSERHESEKERLEQLLARLPKRQ